LARDSIRLAAEVDFGVDESLRRASVEGDKHVDEYRHGLSLVRLFVGTSLYQTFFVLVASYTLHFGGQALGALTVSFGAVPMRLHEAARMLGASRSRRLVSIDLRLIGPGIAAGGGLVLLSVLKELPATLMLRPIGFNTLATRINGTAEEALLIDAGQLALLLIALSGALSWLLVLRRRR
jgi:iron(III) transport system permease protein